ncbi:MAG: hypothetical protein J6J36_02670 [Clostridia bacterium]|nr:hypothetical protein [Clostridia bacterium]
MRFFNWLKHAKQRIKKGYSYRDVYSIDYWFLDVIPQMLEELASVDRLGIPMYEYNKVQEENEDLSDEEIELIASTNWRSTLRTMAYYLREGKEPTQEKNEYDDKMFWNWNTINEPPKKEEKEIRDKWMARELEIEQYRQEQLKKGLEMFCENIERLWW